MKSYHVNLYLDKDFILEAENIEEAKKKSFDQCCVSIGDLAITVEEIDLDDEGIAEEEKSCCTE